MREQVLSGVPASPGIALGSAWRPAQAIQTSAPVPAEGRAHQRDLAVAALSAAAQALAGLAAGLSGEEAEIIETGALIGEDPILIGAVEQGTLSDGLGAAEAIIRATDEHANAIAAIADETLAARADDVRSLGRRAARLASGQTADPPPGGGAILIADDLGPGDVAEHATTLAGIALAAGGATAHAAIVARSLGLPMVTGLGEQVLEIAGGASLVVDGSRGSLILEPSAQRVRDAGDEMAARVAAVARARELSAQPALTTDGTRITVLANVASPEELKVGLRAGAEGIGLLRTELAFLDATGWPSAQQHADALRPILAGLGTRPAVVRVLDFGADKAPPFLHGVAQRGLELLLAHEEALLEQLRAILLCSRERDVRLLLPMVDSAAQVRRSLALLERASGALQIDRLPPLGAMIETPLAAQNADDIAQCSDFLSIGTNDLTAATLGADRFAVSSARSHHPRVLRWIARAVDAAHAAGIRIEVCGEAASDPIMLPLLVGLGVDELSVGAARVGEVRGWIRQLDGAEAAGLARSALTMDDADEVESATRPLAVVG